MNIPSELKYTKDHEWIKIEGNTAIVGITDFAQGEFDLNYLTTDDVIYEVKLIFKYLIILKLHATF